MKISILSDFIHGYKSRAFLFPILKYKPEIEKRGFEVSISRTYSDLDLDCDCLLVEDNMLVDHDEERRLSPKIHTLRDEVDRFYWFDTADSAGGADMSEVIPIVDKFYKKQLLRNREQYRESLWSTRVHIDYYDSNLGLERKKDPDEVITSPQVESKSDLEKLDVYWNLGYEPYFPYMKGKNVLFNLPTWFLERFPWDTFQTAPGVWMPADKQRKIPLSARFSTSYPYAALEYHREEMLEVVSDRVETKKLNTFEYWSELRNTKILLSPFGHGEVCHRDFEGFLSGCLVIKPRMDHLETWPPVYEANETIVEVEWDMSDLEETVDRMIEHEDERQRIAQQGQRRYQQYITGESAAKKFVDRFVEIVSE